MPGYSVLHRLDIVIAARQRCFTMENRLAAKTLSGDAQVAGVGKMPGRKSGPETFWRRSRNMKTPEKCHQHALVPLQGNEPSLKLRVAKRSN